MAGRDSIDTTHDPRAIIATRVFDAPRALVFDVWTDPKHLAQWWGPDGFTTTTRAHDARAGGIWRFVMHGPDGRDYQNRITYDEIVRPERIVYHHGGGDDVEPVQIQVTVTFEDLGLKTRLAMRMVFPSPEERDRVIKEYKADAGLVQTLARLEEHLATIVNATASAAQDLVGREVAFTRVLDAPPSLVFAAWTDAKHMAAWWGPDGFTNPVCEVDARPGGAIHIVMRAPYGVDYPMKGVFREVVVPERIVFTTWVEDEAGKPLFETLTTVTFAGHGGKTTLDVRQRIVAATAKAVPMIAGMEPGWTQTLDRLAAYVRARPAPGSHRH